MIASLCSLVVADQQTILHFGKRLALRNHCSAKSDPIKIHSDSQLELESMFVTQTIGLQEVISEQLILSNQRTNEGGGEIPLVPAVYSCSTYRTHVARIVLT